MILLAVEVDDTHEDLEWLVAKIASLRIFNDEAGQMNLGLAEVNGDCLVVSQFTLYASTRKGKRPSYLRSARPEQAIPMYEQFLVRLEEITGRKVATGVFGADMQVSLVNDGPVTTIIDSRLRE